MPGNALSWSAVAVLMSSGAAVAAAVAAGGLGVWAILKTGATANRRAAATNLRRRLDIGGLLVGWIPYCGRVRESARRVNVQVLRFVIGVKFRSRMEPS